MKIRISLLLTLLITISFLSPIKASASESASIYGPYNSFKELYDAYMQAVENEDLAKQEYLLEIGKSSLEQEIKISEEEYDGSEIYFPMYDAVAEHYRNEVMPKYFSYHYFETRDNGVCLTLGNKLSYWSSQNKADGWNATYIGYRNDPHWDNTDIMKEQFYCHARLGYAAYESEWNLEPWRTSMNSITCN